MMDKSKRPETGHLNIDELMYLARLFALQTKYDYENQLNGKPTDSAESHAQRLRSALEAALKQYPLPDDLYDSKDWKSSGYAARVEWLHVMYESKKQELEAALKPSGMPVAYLHRGDYGTSLHFVGHHMGLHTPLFAVPPAQTPHDHGPQAETVAEAARDVGKWLNERPSRPLDLRHVAMLVAHVQTPVPPETTPINEVIAQWDADLAQGQMAPEQAADFVRREREFAAAQADGKPGKARPVTPYTCPKCHALWLHWPSEQTGFGEDTLNCRSVKWCDYCEKGGVEQLERLERVPAVLAAPPAQTPVAEVTRAAGVCCHTEVKELFHSHVNPLKVGEKLYRAPPAQPDVKPGEPSEALIAQRDELLTVLRGVEKRCAAQGFVGMDGQYLKEVRAAIAKAEGGAAPPAQTPVEK